MMEPEVWLEGCGSSYGFTHSEEVEGSKGVALSTRWSGSISAEFSVPVFGDGELFTFSVFFPPLATSGEAVGVKEKPSYPIYQQTNKQSVY